MKLYHSPTSPFVRKAMVVAILTGQEGEIETVPGSGSPMEPNAATLGANPLGKVPALVTDAGETLFDSRVICRYLDARAGAGLTPEGDFAALTREALADGIMDAGVLAVHEHRFRAEGMRNEAYREGQIEKIRRAIAVLEAGADALDGPARLDTIAAGCALGYVDLRFPDLGWCAGAPRLAAWAERFAATPAMAATAP
jgi:glutathione S-transferase